MRMKKERGKIFVGGVRTLSNYSRKVALETLYHRGLTPRLLTPSDIAPEVSDATTIEEFTQSVINRYAQAIIDKKRELIEQYVPLYPSLEQLLLSLPDKILGTKSIHKFEERLKHFMKGKETETLSKEPIEEKEEVVEPLPPEPTPSAEPITSEDVLKEITKAQELLMVGAPDRAITAQDIRQLEQTLTSEAKKDRDLILSQLLEAQKIKQELKEAEMKKKEELRKEQEEAAKQARELRTLSKAKREETIKKLATIPRFVPHSPFATTLFPELSPEVLGPQAPYDIQFSKKVIKKDQEAEKKMIKEKDVAYILIPKDKYTQKEAEAYIKKMGYTDKNLTAHKTKAGKKYWKFTQSETTTGLYPRRKEGIVYMMERKSK